MTRALAFAHTRVATVACREEENITTWEGCLEPAEAIIRISEGNNNDCSDAEESPPSVGRGAWSAGSYAIRLGTPDSGGAIDHTLSFVEGS